MISIASTENSKIFFPLVFPSILKSSFSIDLHCFCQPPPPRPPHHCGPATSATTVAALLLASSTCLSLIFSSLTPLPWNRLCSTTPSPLPPLLPHHPLPMAPPPASPPLTLPPRMTTPPCRSPSTVSSFASPIPPSFGRATESSSTCGGTHRPCAATCGSTTVSHAPEMPPLPVPSSACGGSHALPPGGPARWQTAASSTAVEGERRSMRRTLGGGLLFKDGSDEVANDRFLYDGRWGVAEHEALGGEPLFKDGRVLPPVEG